MQPSGFTRFGGDASPSEVRLDDEVGTVLIRRNINLITFQVHRLTASLKHNIRSQALPRGTIQLEGVHLKQIGSNNNQIRAFFN